ncbi:MAG: DUF222 domain-containing protein [Actinomycetia bacterium]|nr:DUF222 domain-containing protein [Actinomycetes bacterium]
MNEGGSQGGSVHRVRVALPSAPVKGASVEDLKERIRTASEAKAKVEAFRAEAAAELARRAGNGFAEKTLRDKSGQSTRGTRQELETGKGLNELPVTSDAFGRGKISYGHAKIIVKTAQDGDIDEQELVDKAQKQPVDVFAHTARRHVQQRTEDDGMSILRRQRSNRKAWIRVDRGSGMTVLHALLDPINGAKTKGALSKMTNQMWREEDPRHRPTTGQRMADALVELLCGKRKEEDCKKNKKKQGGQGPVLVLVAQYDPITQLIRDARLGDGTPLPVEAVKDLACQGRILPAIFDSRGQVLWAGTSRRVASPTQKMLLIARDRNCVGCGADPAWCQAHHLVYWQNGGPTDIDNMVLLCSRCHHRVHDQDWEVVQTPSGKYVLRPPSSGGRRSRPVKTSPGRRGRSRPPPG